MQSNLAQQIASLRRCSDRPQAKRGTVCLKKSNHHPPRLQVRPDEAQSRPPANRSAADFATKLRITTAARSGAARRSSSSCLTARPTLPASKPKRGRPCRQSPHHHCRAKQCGKTKPELLFNPHNPTTPFNITNPILRKALPQGPSWRSGVSNKF